MRPLKKQTKKITLQLWLLKYIYQVTGNKGQENDNVIMILGLKVCK
jgi:hypothetical protein